MNSQPYAMIHRDTQCQTLNEGIRKMNAISNPIFCYQQTVYANNINSDLSYANYIVHDVANERIALTFPKECKWIANIRNNANCKMVLYYKSVHSDLNQGTYFSEVELTPHMNINTWSENGTKIIIYTRGNRNLEIYFDMYLGKSNYSKL